MEWRISKKKSSNSKYVGTINLINEFVFQYSLSVDSYFYNKDSNSGIFIFGKLLPRLNSNLKNSLSPEEIYTLINAKEYTIANHFKGIFTVIIIENGKFKIYNDHLGISKYFYNDNLDIFSNDIKEIKNLVDTSLSNYNLTEYFIFNYNLNGNTFFKNIVYSTPALLTEQTEGERKIATKTYFDILEFLQEKSELKSKNIEDVTDTFQRIICQYLSVWKENSITSTLTAGLDSRIIIGSLRNQGVSDINTLTFGHRESHDAVYASKIAKNSGFNHSHYHLDNSYQDQFEKLAKETVENGNSLVSIFRTHRRLAYEFAGENFSALIMGMAGSDLVRGITYDGLIVSDAVYACWQGTDMRTAVKQSTNQQKLNEVNLKNAEHIAENYSQYDYISHPIKYLLKVIIPLHFAQDVNIALPKLNILLPFTDIDYLETLSKTKYFQIQNYKNYNIWNKKRRIRGLEFSALFLSKIDKELASLSIGKGYTPQDFVNNKYAATLKGLIYKYRSKNVSHVPNISYDDWFRIYLIKQFCSEDFFNKEIAVKMIKKLESKDFPPSEKSYLDFAKLINIDLATKL